MMHGRYILATLVPFLLVDPVLAGPITVFTEVWSAGGNSTGEIPVGGLGSWATLTNGGGLDPAVTVLANQTSARQAVLGYWPVMGFRDRAQYEAERGTVATVPATPVRLYAEVWDGQYGGTGVEFRQIYIDATVSARVSAEAGKNTVDWQFAAPSTQVSFADGTVVSVTYHALRMPDGVPQIQFQDGSPPIGFPGPIYYPTVLEAEVDVLRASTDGGGPVPATPEPSTGLLLAGLALGGVVARRRVW